MALFLRNIFVGFWVLFCFALVVELWVTIWAVRMVIGKRSVILKPRVL